MLALNKIQPLNVLGGVDSNKDEGKYLVFTNTDTIDGVVDFFCYNTGLVLYASTNNQSFVRYTYSDMPYGITFYIQPGKTLRLYGDTDNYSQRIGMFSISRVGYSKSFNISGSVMAICSTIFSYCFKGLFYNGNVEQYIYTAPKLPATELAEGCYEEMFRNCTYLTEAPELPAVSLELNCYRRMFYDCTELSRIKIACNNISTGYGYRNTSLWLQNVAPSGEFIKPSTLSTMRGTSFIPNGWTIIDI